jgi:UDP-N-acetylmuramyl pentapeptide phosphotransferase/UDP-N-acetylglucosamine-1-phosphate transferase
MNMPLGVAAFLLVFGFGMTYAIIPQAKKWGRSWGLVAPPGGRRHHPQDMPLTGGLALFIPLMVAFLAFFGLALAGRLSMLRPEWPRMLSLFLGTT